MHGRQEPPGLLETHETLFQERKIPPCVTSASRFARREAAIAGWFHRIAVATAQPVGNGLQLQVQLLHRPRISSTGRSALNWRAVAMARTERLTSSSSTWAASPHSSQTRKMQSCAQPGWVLAR